MKIGIVGDGIVGSACRFGFEKVGHKVKVHDIKYQTNLFDLFDCEVIYICVPTPSMEDGSCDTSIVECVVADLDTYNGLIVIKSTVIPGTTERLSSKYGKQICFVPEFLRERCAVTDFVENQKLLAVGCHNKKQFKLIKKSHGRLPHNILRMTPTEAELLKYFHNTFNALRVVFANEFYDICEKVGAEYSKVKSGLLLTSSIPDLYLDVNENVRGYSSICWNKDIPALINFSKGLGLKIPLINSIPLSNNNYKKTPFAGTRE